MKELEKPLDLQEEIELVVKKQQEKKTELIGRMRPHKGHTVFEVNCTTGEVVPAKFEVETVNFIAAANGDLSPRKKILAKENCMYIAALNKANALKKFFKQLRKATVVK
jgi:hypothetical protein